MGMNGKDPILQAPDTQRELFNRFSRAADGFMTEDAITAAVNVLINALRQAHHTRAAADARFNELMSKTRSLLMDHYDGSGKRKAGLFPFNQTIHAELFNDRDTIQGKKN